MSNSSQGPFPATYWAEPGKIIAGCCPGGMTDVSQHLASLIDAGVTLVINLMEASEAEIYQRFFQSYEQLLERYGKESGKTIRVEHFPIKDRSIPTRQVMLEIQNAIRKELERGGIVYVHCMGGIGRTGTVIGCYFADQGEAKPLEKLRSLTESQKDHFWPTPQTEEQCTFVSNWKASP